MEVSFDAIAIGGHLRVKDPRIRNEIILRPFTSYLLPFTFYPLPITHYLLPITHYPIPLFPYISRSNQHRIPKRIKAITIRDRDLI